MKKANKIKFCSIILIFAVMITTDFITNGKNTVVEAKTFGKKAEVKEPILEAKLNQTEFDSGEIVELKLTIKNETDSIINLFDIEPERGFEITVRDAKGVSLPLTQDGINRKYPAVIMAREGAYIEAGKKLQIKKFRLDKMFDFNPAGIYTVEIKVIYYIEDAAGNSASSENQEKTLTNLVKLKVK